MAIVQENRAGHFKPEVKETSYGAQKVNVSAEVESAVEAVETEPAPEVNVESVEEKKTPARGRKARKERKNG